MQIHGIDGMTEAQIVREVRDGGRFVIFLWTVSVLILTFKQPTNIHFIPAGHKSFTRGLGPSLVTMLFGWWGIPWGPIYSIESLATNLSGGKDVTDEIMASMRGPSDRYSI